MIVLQEKWRLKENKWIKDRKEANEFIERWLEIKKETKKHYKYKAGKIKRILSDEEAEQVRSYYEKYGIKDPIDLVEFIRR